nr:L10-interacting MYB domain-containing protein-like [Tanacetum cinerariifolium]
MTLEKTIEDGLGPCYKKLATLEEGVSKMMRMLMEEEKKDDMGTCIEKLDKVGWAAQDLMYDTALLLFGQSTDYRKLWLHLKPESCGNWVKSVGRKIMNPQETQQVIAHDKKWVSSTARVKISPINVRLETIVHNKEETFQVIINVIKNSTCFKAFTISAEVPKISLQQKEKKSRRKTMPFLGFTKVIINHFLSQHKSLSKLKFQRYHIIKDDGIVNKLKFVKIREDYHEYGLPIPDMMLNDKIKQLESYQMFFKYSTDLIPPKKSREQKATDTMQALKESKKTSKRQSSTKGSSEGTGRIPKVPNESIVVSATSSKGTGTKPGVLDEEKITLEENVILEWGSEHESKHIEYSQHMSDEEEKKDNYGDTADDDEDEDDDHINVDVEMVRAETVECKNKEMTDLRVEKLEKDVSELKKIDHSAKILATLKSQVPTVVDNYLGSKFDKGVVDTIKNYKRQHDDDKDDDEDPSTGPDQGKKTKRRRTEESKSSKKPSTTKETPRGKASSKGSKTSKFTMANEPVEEPIAKVEINDVINTASEDVVHDANQSYDDSTQAKDIAPKQDWFKQPPRPLNPDPEWNKRQVVTNQPKQPCFNRMVTSTKDPLIFDELMATPTDFSNYAMNRLKIDHLTQEILIGPIYNLMKATCTSSIEHEYNIKECFKALTDRLN